MMYVALDGEAKLLGKVLLDEYLGARYTLTADAAWLAHELIKEGNIERLVRRIAAHRGIDLNMARSSLYALVAQLSIFGMLRAAWQRPLSLYGWLRVRVRWRQRYRATWVGFGLGMLQAYGWLAIGLTGVFVIVRLVAGPGVSMLLLALPGLLFGSCIVHEAGHVLALWLCRRPAVILAHLGYAAVMYMPPPGRSAPVIALAGPLLAGVSYLLASVWCAGAVQVILVATALLHMASLLPWCADGRTIWRST